MHLCKQARAHNKPQNYCKDSTPQYTALAHIYLWLCIFTMTLCGLHVVLLVAKVHKSTVLQLFSRGRSSTTVVRTDPSVKHSAVSRNRSETISQYDNGDSKERNIFSSKEFEQLSEEIMKLNMTLATMSSLNLNTETSQQPVHNSDTAESPLARYSRVVTDANAHLKAAHDKIGSLRKASDDMITVLKKHIENEHENNDCLKAHNSELQQQLSDANDKHATVQKELDEATQRLRGSSNWIVDKAEVELTDKKLGVGGYGTVSVANFRGFQVAAKQLHGMILTSYNRSLFDREMNIASCVRHPNCVHFMGAVVDGEPIILMELLPAVLREILPRELNSLSDEQIPPICADVARALTYLHAMKPKAIIHRDVSSANVLVEPIARNLWRAKISDYGSANFLTKLRTNGPGNAVYAAPEACTPHLQSPKMDVFSFGVLVVEIYLREFPDPNNRDQMVHEVGLIYPKVVTIINKCLCIEPRNRWNMSQVLEQLNH